MAQLRKSKIKWEYGHFQQLPNGHLTLYNTVILGRHVNKSVQTVIVNDIVIGNIVTFHALDKEFFSLDKLIAYIRRYNVKNKPVYYAKQNS